MKRGGWLRVIAGVASWSQSCAYKYPTAYARLPEMVDWIIKVTANSSPQANNNNNNNNSTTPNPTSSEASSIDLSRNNIDYNMSRLHWELNLLHKFSWE